MSSDDSVSRWIDEVKKGNHAGAEALWERYFPCLVRFARERLRGLPRRASDEEDVALSALDSFCRAAERGRFPDLADREGFWRLLLQMTARKAADVVRHETRDVRGGGQVLSESALGDDGSTWGAQGLARIADEHVGPELAAVLAEECQRLLGQLEPELQPVALAKMEGFANAEIAEQLLCSVRTIERRLQLIRRIWEQEMGL
jgi:DNA-directed RNA polymerase specialized sigma24 family protein